jgi:glycoprotein endo-alpha-1,2-mannosidase
VIKKRKLVFYLLFMILVFSSCGGGGGESTQNANTNSSSKLNIGAHYYVWYPQNFKQGHLRSRLSPPQEPLLGQYDSDNPSVAENHIKTASDYGIDFFTLDWWPSRPRQNEAINNGFLKAQNISLMKYCIFYETIDLGYDESTRTVFIDAAKKRKFIDDLKSIAKNYFSHPQYYKINNRPVIFFYVTRTLGGDYRSMLLEARAELNTMGFDPYFVGDEIYWISTHNTENGPVVIGDPNVDRIALFDAITSYNSYAPSYTSHAGYGSTSQHLVETAQLYERFKLYAPNSKIIPGVLPGYNDRGHRLSINNYVISRQYAPIENQGSMLKEYLNQIGLKYLDKSLNTVVITSWNEWNEDTAIEPISASKISSNDIRNGDYTQGFVYGGDGFEALREVVNLKNQNKQIDK